MIMSTKLIRLIIVVLKFPKVIAVFIVYARAIYQAMSTHPRFVALAPKVTVLNTDISALEVAQTGFKRKPQTVSIEDRNNALEKVKADLRSLKYDVQALADADSVNAKSIITSAGMSWKTLSNHGKQKNGATDGDVSGSVNLTAEGAGPHEWRWSSDGVVWHNIRATLGATKTAYGFTPGIVYQFQNSKILPNEQEGEWSPIVTLMVR
jgi:hypothetical protein